MPSKFHKSLRILKCTRIVYLRFHYSGAPRLALINLCEVKDVYVDLNSE